MPNAPEDARQRYQRRQALMARHDDDWGKYGFTERERTAWRRGGVPGNRAPVAAVLREVNYRGYTVRPDAATRTKLGGASILQLALDGASAMDIERAIAQYRPGRTGADSPGAWRRSILAPEFEPVTNHTDAQIAMRSKNVRAIQHALRLWGRSRMDAFERRAHLLTDAAEYRSRRRSPSRNLVAYGRGFGVVDERSLQALAATLPNASETSATTNGALLLATPGRWMYVVADGSVPHPRASDAADVVQQLPKGPGCALVEADDPADAAFLAWNHGSATLTAITIPIAAVETMMKTRVASLPPTATPTMVDLQHPLAAARIVVDPTLLTVASIAALFNGSSDATARAREGRVITLEAPKPAPAPATPPATPHPDAISSQPVSETPTGASAADSPQPATGARPPGMPDYVQAERERADARLRVSTLEADNWAALGFTNAERAVWIKFGIPANRAPLAAIAREVTDVEGFTLTPDRLYTRLTGGKETILDALLAGTNAWRLEQRIARSLGATLHNSPHAWCRDILHPRGFDATGGDTGIVEGPIHTTRLPALQDALLNWATLAKPALMLRSRLGMEAHGYRRGFDPGVNLLQYARGFGVLSVGPALRDLASSLPYPHEAHLDYLAASIFESNADDRFLYRGRNDARELVEARMRDDGRLTFSPEALPSATGVAWLCDNDAKGLVVAWSIDHAHVLSAAVAPADRLIAALRGHDPLRLRAEIGFVSLVDQRGGISGSDRAIAALAALTEMHARDGEPVERPAGSGTQPRHRRPSSVSVLYTREDGPRGQRGEGTERVHQWKVRGHYRNQWYPSTKEYKRIWIEEFMQGPAGAPVINLDRVRVVR